MLPVALACQHPATLTSVLSDTMYLFEDHDRDAGDTIMMAYEKGTFTKVWLATVLCVYIQRCGFNSA